MLRERIVGSAVEPLVAGLRDRLDIIGQAFRSDESLGDTRNNQLALRLAVGLARPGSLFVDVGAHIGSVISAARRRRDLRIEAFEAIPRKADKLRRRFPGVTIHCCALAEHDGEASFYINLDATGYSSLNRNGARTEEIRVPLRRLDDILATDTVDMMKIDVEGAELGVLRGGARLIARCGPTIMFESGPEEVLGHTKPAMWQWLEAQGYGVFAPDRVAHTAPPMTLDVFLDSHQFPRRTTNYFAIRRDRIEEVRGRARAIGGVQK